MSKTEPPTVAVTTSSNSAKWRITVLFAGFIATGAATVLLAPLLPLLATRWNLNDQTAGLLFTCQFLASTAGTLASGYLIRRIGFGGTLFFGYLLMCAFGFGVWRVPWPWLAALASANGLGLGLVIPATNMAVSEAFPEGRASALNLINLSWSVGAIACPSLMAAAQRARHLDGTLVGLSGFIAIIAICVLGTKSRPVEGDTEPGPGGVTPPTFFLLGALFFLYIGCEGAVANWLATYAKRTVLSSGVVWMTAPSFFWAAMMVGRGLAPAVLRKIPERQVVIGGLLLSTAGTTAILVGKTASLVLAGAALTGFGMCSVFPIFIAMVSQHFPQAATRVSSYLFAMAGLGGAVLPFLVGVVSSYTGRLQAGLLIALAGILLQIALFRALLSLRVPELRS